MSAAIMPLMQLGQFNDATREAKSTSASVALVVVDPDANAGPLGVPARADLDNATDLDEDAAAGLQPGAIPHLRPGEDIRSFTPPTNRDLEPFTRLTRQDIASSMGMTPEDMSGDYAGMNFSQAKKSQAVQGRRIWGHRQRWLLPAIQEMELWVREAAESRGEAWPAPSTWTNPALPQIDPEREGNALMRAIRTGLMTVTAAVRERGLDPDAFFAERAAELEDVPAPGARVRFLARRGDTAGPDAAERGGWWVGWRRRRHGRGVHCSRGERVRAPRREPPRAGRGGSRWHRARCPGWRRRLMADMLRLTVIAATDEEQFMWSSAPSGDYAGWRVTRKFDIASCDLTRMNSGRMAVLEAHEAWDLERRIGSVVAGSARVDGGNLMCEVDIDPSLASERTAQRPPIRRHAQLEHRAPAVAPRGDGDALGKPETSWRGNLRRRTRRAERRQCRRVQRSGNDHEDQGTGHSRRSGHVGPGNACGRSRRR